MNFIQRIIARALGFPVGGGADSAWVGATVRAGDVASGRSLGTGPAGPLVARASQYVLICATLNARNCAAVPIRLMRPKRGFPSFSPFGSAPSNPFGSAPSNPFKAARAKEARLRHYRNHKAVGVKAAAYAAYGDDVEEVTDHDVVDLLQKPNPFMTGTEFDELAYLSMELAGNAYEYISGEGPETELYPMRAPYVRAVPSETGFIDGYVYARDTSQPMFVPVDSVLHYRHMSHPADPFYGYGPLHAVGLEADLVHSASLSEHYSWKNMRRPDFAVETTAPVTADQRQQIKDMLAAEFRGLHKHGTPVVLSMAKVVPLGFTPKDFEYINGMKISNEMIWNAFGVPQSLLQLNDANLASSTTGHGQYNQQTVMPRVAKRAEFLTEFLLPRFGITPGEMWFAPDNPGGDDDVMDADRIVKLVSCTPRLMTQNEARSELGLPPSADPGADLLSGAAPAQASPFGDAANPFGAASNSFPFKGSPLPSKITADWIVDATKERRDHAGQHAGGRRAGDPESDVPVESGSDGVHGACASCGGREVRTDPDRKVHFQVPDGLKFYGRFAEKASSKALMIDEPRALAKLRSEFEGELTDWFGKLVSDLVNSEAAGVSLAASDTAALSAKLDDMARDYLARMSKIGLDEAALSFGLDVKPLSSLVYLEQYVPRLVDAVTRGMAEGVRDAVARGLSEGMSIPDIADAIKQEIPGIAAYKAERIARTEASHAYTRGKVDAWKQAGIEKKEWVLGGNPCQVCLDIAAANPEPIPMDQPFYTGDFWGTGNTPAHPNCTCTTAPVISPPEEGGLS